MSDTAPGVVPITHPEEMLGGFDLRIVHEMDVTGHPLICWCLFPHAHHLARGDVMLAQKIALETIELAALAVANRFPIGDTNTIGDSR